MFNVSLRIAAWPQHRNEMVQALRSIMLHAKSERGFVSAHLCEDVLIPHCFHYAEEWRTEEDLEAQALSHRFTRLLIIMEAAALPPVLEFRTISSARGLDYLEEVRFGHKTLVTAGLDGGQTEVETPSAVTLSL